MRYLRLPGCLVLLFGLAFAQSGSAKQPPSKVPHRSKPNVLLITLDTTRADRMGFLGSTLGLTPNLDAVAKQGTAFTHAYSHVPLTTASHATILTGTFPQYNHVNDFGVPLAAGLPFLPDILHQNGYKTAAFVGALVLDPVNGTAPGFDRGFDVYDAGYRMKSVKDSRYDTIERRGGEVVRRALKWLQSRPRNAPPFFLWVHLYDPHDPYDPPEPYKSKFANPYDGEIAYADAMLGKVFAELRSSGTYDNTLIVMMADHGEAFGEHGERTHGIFLYDETIHVPLFVKPPQGHPSTQPRSDAPVCLVDVTPTVLAVAGISIPKEVQGKSLVPLIDSAVKKTSEPSRPIYSETDYPHRAFKWSSLRAMRSGKYLVIDAPKRELYNRSADPQAVKNLATSSAAVADTLVAQLQQFRDKTATDLASAAKLDPGQAEKLNALGYVGGDTGLGHEGRIGGIDPKDRIEVANLLHDGMMDVEQGRNREAIPILEKVIETEPGSAIVYVQLGTAWVRLREYAKALPILRKAIELKAESSMAKYELGLALFETGSWKEAAGQFEDVVERMPRWADAQFSLASVYARIDRVPDAMQHLDLCLGLDANHYRGNLLRGRILSLQGQAADALPNLKKAVEVQPESREAHQFLADAYQELGDATAAARERALAGQR